MVNWNTAASDSDRLDFYANLKSTDTYLAFDVDGTLTPSRGELSDELKSLFVNNIAMDRVALITGSDREKTIEQVGLEFWESCGFALQCCGNEVYKNGVLQSTSDWTPSDELEEALKDVLNKSSYPVANRAGRHVEYRPGMINFSIVGRNAFGDERSHYANYDSVTGERNFVAMRLRKQFPDLDFVCGGDTGIDIFPIGKDKAQAIDIIGESLIFFGDRMDRSGNDFSLMQALKRVPASTRAKVYHVSGPDEVYSILLRYLSKGIRV